MATIKFTQCHPDFDMDHMSRMGNEMPVQIRGMYYEFLLRDNPDGVFSTIDEHFLLVAQYLKRKGELKNLTLISVCGCGDNFLGDKTDERVIEIDSEGDMSGDCHHGFFPQRLKYLR